ncbi:hypothetical protein [Chishuiella sp.]|uniref:hypothetical protein n=1 Tax=Chishuiella sp. TaxID=1969467 RepID=UPI0028A82D1C|nr:hypothetical protein [Chishuiella sp.]
MKLHYTYNILFILVITILMSYFYSNYIETDILLRSYFSDKYSNEIINNYFENKNRWKFLSYILIPIVIILKILIISYTIQIVSTLVFIDENRKFKLRNILEAVSNAEWVSVASTLLKLTYFMFLEKFSLEDLSNFEFYSLKTIFSEIQLYPWQEYPLKAMDVWTIVYLGILIFYVKDSLKLNYSKAIQISLLSYLPWLFVWIILIMYLLVNLS